MTAIVNKTTTSGQEPTEFANSTLAEAFSGQIRKGSPEALNRMIILLRTLFAMLIPASYIALLGVVSYFTFYHALFGLNFNQGAPFPIAASLYVLPLLSGSLPVSIDAATFFTF